jgi:hypothetical protein
MLYRTVHVLFFPFFIFPCIVFGFTFLILQPNFLKLYVQVVNSIHYILAEVLYWN